MTEKKENEENQNLVHELIQKIDQDPHNAQNYYALATVLVKQQSFDQAEELLVKARGLFSDQPSQDLLTYLRARQCLLRNRAL